MAELKRTEINPPVQVTASDKVITLKFDNEQVSKKDLQILGNTIENSVKEVVEKLQANMEYNREETLTEIKSVKKTIESKHISPQDLDALKSLIHKKAETILEKQKGVQLTLNMFLSSDQETIKAYNQIYNQERGKIKSRIWVELNKECLGRKGNAPKNRIPDKQVEQAFDFVRKWGGFSI